MPRLIPKRVVQVIVLLCNGKGVGTIDEAEMTVHLSDISLDKHIYLPLVRK